MNNTTNVNTQSPKNVSRSSLVNEYASVVQNDNITLKDAKFELQDVLHKAIVNQSGDIKHRALACYKVPVTSFNRTNEGGVKVEEPIRLTKTDQGAHFSGIAKCNNSNYCPCCMERILVEKSKILQAIEKAWLSKPNRSILLVTYTLSHDKDDCFCDLVDSLKDAKRKMLQWRAVKELKKSVNYFSSVTALEATISDINGLHPHMHDAWYLESIPTVQEVLDLRDSLCEEWKKALNKKGYDCSFERGVNISFSVTSPDGDIINTHTNEPISPDIKDQKIFSQGSTGQYLSKVAKELTFSFVKSTKRHENRTLMHVLIDQVMYYTKENEKIIYKYVQAMQGRARIYINPELYAMEKEYLNEIEFQPDLPFEDEPEKALQVTLFEFSHDEWKRVCFNRKRKDILLLAALDKPPTQIQRLIRELLDTLPLTLPPPEYKTMMIKRSKESIWSWIGAAA